MTAPAGGMRDRLIVESHYQMLKAALDDLGWFDENRTHQRIRMVPGPWPKGEEIPVNTFVITWEDRDATDAEIGSNASEVTHTVYHDFYAEPPPLGGEALGKLFIGDVLGILIGEFPDIGRSWPVLEVLDYRLATPDLLFNVEYDTERSRTTKVHHYDQAWERYWYVCIAEVIEPRGFGDG